jgi:hypothetical protein
MLLRRRVSPLRALITAVALAISALVLISAWTPTASALQPCPAGGVPTVGAIDSWTTQWSSRGITACSGLDQQDPMNVSAWVFIVDRNDGAKVRILSQTHPGQPGSTNPWAWQFTKRTASQWFDWAIANVGIPSSSRQLFAVSNGSFYVDSSSSASSAISLPEQVGGSLRTWGWAIGNHTDSAWSAFKRYLRVQHPSNNPQSVQIGSFPQFYGSNDMFTTFGSAWYDGTVGFEPTYCAVDCDPHRRTYAAVAGSRFYLLNMARAVTPGDATAVIQSVAGGLATAIQLDGGGSTQMRSRVGSLNSAPLSRPVPEAIALYMAP